MTYKQRAADALAASDGTSLAALLVEASSKADKKTVKKAIYLAGQRGIEVPDAASAKAPGASLGGAPVIVMMGPPLRNAGRLFTLPIHNTRGIEVVEAYFEMPQGIERLHSSQSDRGQYVPWSRQMCAKGPKHSRERVPVSEALMTRKISELATHVRKGKIGSDVDLTLAHRLAGMAIHAEHPCRLLDSTVGTPLDIEGLAALEWGLSPFNHDSPMDAFRARGVERGRIWAGSNSPLHEATREWAAEWGAELIIETLLDCTEYARGAGNLDVAATYLQAAEDPEAFAAEAAHFIALR
ncbi:MAG: hypothetical protein ACI9OJ_004563 [Myxococcota bacterium]|jgi:hypothetical protein